MSESLKLPRIETELEIITDRYHPDFGTPQLRKKKKNLVLHNPELYLDPDQLDTEKYDWEVFDDFYPQQSRPQTVADNIRFGKEISIDDDRPHSAPLAPVFSTEIVPKFESRRAEMLRAGRTLKKANEKLGPIRLQSLLPSSQQQKEETEQKIKYTLPDKFHDDTLKMDKELIKRYEHAGPLKDQLRLGVDNIPILKKPFIYQPEAIMKATSLRLHPPESVLNIWQDSEFPLGKISGEKHGTEGEQGNDTAISINHMETCVYRMTRRYGYVFEDKEKRRKLKYAHLMKLRRVPKRNSVLRKSTMTNEVKETSANAGTDLLISVGLKTGKKITDEKGAYNSFSPMQSPHKRQEELLFPGLEEAKTNDNSNESNNHRSISPLTVQIPNITTTAPKSALKDPSRTLSRVASTRRVSIKIKTEGEEDEQEPSTPTITVTAADTNGGDNSNQELPDDQFIQSVATNLSLQLGFNDNVVVEGDTSSEKKNESNEGLSVTTAIPESTTPVFKSPTKNKPFASSPGLLKLSFSQPSFINTNNQLTGQQPLSARSSEKETPLLLPAKPETIESLRKSMDSLDRPMTNLIAKSSEASFSSVPFKSLSINKNQSKSFDFGENNANDEDEDHLSSKLSMAALSTDSYDTSSKPTTPSSRNRQRTEEEEQQLLLQQRQRKLTPVAFSFNSEGKITDIHYQSQLPKKRPSSADRSTATTKARGNRKGSALLSSPSKLLQYEEFLKQQKQEREEEEEKQQILASAATMTPAPVSISKTLGKSSDSNNNSQPFFPHYLRLEKPRRANSHRKDLTKIVFISDEDRRRERSALMSIYDMCFGDQWTRADNWGSTLEVRFWYGIGVNVEGYVFEINLPNNNLTGRFPDMLIEFPYLEVINVDHNQLYGTLPDYALQSCEHLKILSACNNELDGGIPFNLLTNCEKMKEIWLNNNQFDGSIEDGLYEMTALTHLCLDNNQLSGPLSTKISKLQNLIYLSLGRNQLTGVIPQTIVALQDLELLSLHSNQFEGKVPMWLDILPKLDELRLYNNPKLENHLKDMESVKSGVKKKNVK
jgi:hypothetical protein